MGIGLLAGSRLSLGQGSCLDSGARHPWRARRGHRPPVRCLELSDRVFVQSEHRLLHRSCDVGAAVRCACRGLRRAGHGWPAAASQPWTGAEPRSNPRQAQRRSRSLHHRHTA